MKILSVEYKRPYRREQNPEVEWEFSAETDEKMPHGYPCYAGDLRKNGAGWQARYCQRPWGPIGSDRFDAILGNLIHAVDFGRERAAECTAHENAVNARAMIAAGLCDGLPKKIEVHLKNHDKVEEPPIFRVTFSGLSETEVKMILALTKGVL